MKVAFLDRDGVINKEINYLHKIKDFQYTNRCIDGLLLLITLGFQLVIVTNQAGIAKGIFSKDDYHCLTAWMLDDLKSKAVDVLECMYCPHHPDGSIPEYTVACECRKPGHFMLETVKIKYDVDMRKSIMIGDKISDIYAAQNANVGRSFLVRSGHPLNNDLQGNFEVEDDLYSVANLLSNGA